MQMNLSSFFSLTNPVEHVVPAELEPVVPVGYAVAVEYRNAINHIDGVAWFEGAMLGPDSIGD